MKHIHRTFRAWLVCMLAMLAALPASADVTPDQLEFTKVDGGYSVTKKSGATLEGALVIPETYDGKPVVEIGGWAFCDCSGLTSVTIPDGVTTIGRAAFANCSGLTNVSIPDGVTTIGERAFCDCSGLTSVTIPDAMTSIGDYAFGYCSGLTSIRLGKAVTTIGRRVFSACSNLTQIEVDETNSKFCSVEGVLYNKAKSTLLCCPGGRQGEFTIPDGVTIIGDEAFHNCSSLTCVNIGSGVRSIGEWVFVSCSKLTQIEVDEANPRFCSVEGVLYNKSKGTLLYCPGGRQGEFTIPDGVKSIAKGAFSYCEGLTGITFGSGVRSIGEWVFEGCSGLTSMTIPDAVTTIGDYAFAYCSNLTSVNIGSGVTRIGNGVFYCASGLTGITIPDGVTRIGESAFASCKGLTSVTIGSGVTSIGKNAFYDCKGLTSVTIGSGVTSIEGFAFSYCEGLTSVTIGSSVTSIEGFAFSNCEGLTSIICRAMTPPVCESYCFDRVNPSACTLFVPIGTAESYRTANIWKYFKNIEEADLTGVGSVETDAAEAGAVEIYGLDGVRYPEGIKKLRPGNYVVRQGGRSRKIHVR